MKHRKGASLSLMASSLSNALLQFLIMVVIARISGSVATGEYALAQSYMLPAVFLSMFGLRQQALMDTHNSFDGSDFYAVRTLYATALLAAMVCMVALVQEAHIVAIAAAFALVKTLDGYTEIGVSIMQRAARYRLIAVTALSRTIAGFACFYGVYAMTENMPLSLLALAGALLLNLLVFEYRRARTMIPFERALFTRSDAAKKARRALLAFGVPLSISVVVSNLQLSGVRIVLEHYQSAADLGHFSVIMQLITVGLLVISSISTACLPALRHAFLGRHLWPFCKLLGVLSALIVGCIGAGAVMSYYGGDWLMVSIFGDEFSGLRDLLLAACAASVPFYLCTIIAQAATACRIAHGQIWTNLVGLVAILALAYVWIPIYGAFGAFYALGAALTLQSFFAIGLIAYSWKQPTPPASETTDAL
jgi:O-antigen/teichoic acid export membrane protein